MSKAKGKLLIRNLCGDVIGVQYRDLILIESPSSFVDDLVKRHHYSKKCTRNRMLSMIVTKTDDTQYMGFIQLGYGIRPHMKHTISNDITKSNYAEFDRMWLSDDLPKYSETIVISMLLYYLKIAKPEIIYLITYADGSVGNTGTIYKASNAFVLDKIPVDFYMTASGERIHPVTLWHRHKTRAKEAMEKIYPGIKHITNEFQYRFLYVLDEKKRKQFMEAVK